MGRRLKNIQVLEDHASYKNIKENIQEIRKLVDKLKAMKKDEVIKYIDIPK
jgi:hypothetical protein